MFIAYFVYTVIAQQKTLNSYAQEKEKYNTNIETAQEEQEELRKMKDNINSDEYIEQIAREKLGMYYPYESRGIIKVDSLGKIVQIYDLGKYKMPVR